MNISLAQQYYYLNWRKKVNIRQLSLLKESHDRALIRHIQSLMIAGVNPSKDRELEPIYTYLISEYGEEIFNLEDIEDGVFIAE